MNLRCLVFIALFLMGAHAKVHLNYNDVLQMGSSCPQLESCKRTGDRFSSGNRQLVLPKERNCACDSLCDLYGDCCIDAPSVVVRETLSEFSCHEMKQFGGVFMIDSCLPSYDGPDDVRYQCESIMPGDVTDPIGSMPVTNNVTGVTFKNYYCSICNYMTDNIVLWSPRLECPTVTLMDTNNSVTEEFAFNNLASSDKSWGLHLAGDNGSLFFHDCEVDPMMPSLLESKIRLCKPGLVSNCPPDWEDDDVRTLCSSYMGARSIHGGEKYRNAHCALCNGVDTTHLSCKAAGFREITTFRHYDNHAFSLLLDINVRSGKEVGKINICEKGEIFDPFFKVCRSLECLPGYRKKEKECVPRGLSDLDYSNEIEEAESGNGPIVPNESEHITVHSKDNIYHTLFEYRDTSVENDSMENVNKTAYSLSNSKVDDALKKELDKLKNCLLISLTSDDYVLLPDMNIYVPKYNKTYEPTNYHNIDGSILVCSHLTGDESTVKFMPEMGYITTLGISISMVCLILHLIVFCIVPELQNLSGKNLASQCIALIGAYFCFLLGSIGTIGFTTCSVISFLTVYFFLVSFFWMAIMAFDVWRTLKMATTQLRVANGRQLKRFFCYSFFAWVAPAVIISIAALAEYTDLFLEEYRPGFASPHCWFKRRLSLLVYFAAPLIAIMVANLIFFILSVFILWKAKKNSLKQQNKNQKRNFKLYSRLALLMGFTWLTGFIASSSDIDPLWYVFVVCNTLQGLFIFVGFSCTRKVYCHFRDMTRKVPDSSSKCHSGTSNTSNLSSNTSFSSRFLTRFKKSVSPNRSSISNSSIRKVNPLF